ncbi:hypothetical protein [Cellulosimicrobium composti]|uniref:hypothetical protein n=1 Tax=Cellulosimicrobium composti TaxID=2672572 RepID=UPI001CEDF9AA|nr:hypothetical protein [Cellulosimicrobium composti]
MTEALVVGVLAALGTVLVVEAILARHELLVYATGWREQARELPDGLPYARGADPDRPPDAYVVYLDGIGKLRFRDTRDGGRLVQAVIARGPTLRVLGQVQPYSPLVRPLVGRPVWDWFRRRAGIVLFLHNVVQTFVAADRRYRPLYNDAVGAHVADQLRLAGYRAGTGTLVVLLCYSGGAQVATGAVRELYAQLRAPIVIVTVGGFHSGTNDLADAEHVYRLTSGADWIERFGTVVFPARWRSRVTRRSAWNRAVRAGRVTDVDLSPAAHIGAGSYISPDACAPDGRTFLDRTTDEVLRAVRRHADASRAGDVRRPEPLADRSGRRPAP